MTAVPSADVLLALFSLADALQLERRATSAAGTIDDLQVTLEIGRTPPQAGSERCLRVRVSPPRFRDLERRLHAVQPPPYGRLASEWFEEVWTSGEGSLRRLRAFATGELLDRLRQLAPLRAELSDLGVTGELSPDKPTARLAEQVRTLVALERAALAAAAGERVSFADDVADALPALRQAAAELGVTLTSCPLGFVGEIAGRRVQARRFTMIRSRVVISVQIAFHQALPGEWDLWSIRRRPRRRLEAALAVLLRRKRWRSPGTGHFAFDRRFYLAQGELAPVARIFASLRPQLLAFADELWFRLQQNQLILALHVPPTFAAADAVHLVHRGIEIARLIGGEPEPPASGGPFR